MPTHNLYRYRYFDSVTRRKLVTRYVLSEADALKTLGPDAERLNDTLEVREVGDPSKLTGGHVQSSPGKPTIAN